MAETCAKGDAWKAQDERNGRYDRTFEKIERHLDAQTTIMKDIARQGEQIITLQREQKENRQLIDKLFERDREYEKTCRDFQNDVNERLHQHELEPVKEQRVERLKVSTGAWLVLITVFINRAADLIMKAFAKGGGP